MKRLILICSVIFFWTSVNAQQFEYFKINGSLVVREGNHFTLQKDNNSIYLGALTQIPHNRSFPNFHERDSLLNGLLIQFLGSAVDKANLAKADTIFSDGFILNRGITAVGAKYSTASDFDVYVGKRMVESTSGNNTGAPKTVDELVNRIGAYLEVTDKKAINIKKNKSKYYHPIQMKEMDGYEYELSLNNASLSFIIIFAGDDNENLNTVYASTNTGSLKGFIETISRRGVSFNGWFDKFGLYVLNEEMLSASELYKFLTNTGEVKVKVETDEVEINNIETARSWGAYQFIADYIYREVQQPFANRKIIYLDEDDPIFVQDSVLDIYRDGQFKRVSKKPIDATFKDFIFPELLFRYYSGKSTELLGDIVPINSNAVTYQFLEDDFHVLATFDESNGAMNFYYVLGWAEVKNTEHEQFVKLLSQIGIRNREKIMLKFFEDEVLVISPQEGSELAVRIWNKNDKQLNKISSISQQLSEVQKDIAIEVIAKKYKETSGIVNLVTHQPDIYQKLNSLLFSFSGGSIPELHLYKQVENGKIKKTSLKNEKYFWSNEPNPFYQALLMSEEFIGELSLISTNNDIRVVANTNQNFGILNADSIVALVTLNQELVGSSIENKLIDILSKQYPTYQEEANILHYQRKSENEKEYLIIEYPNAQVCGIISNIPILTGLIGVAGLKTHASNEKIVRLVLKYISGGVEYKTIDFIGEHSELAWLVKIDSLNFLAGSVLSELYWLGDGFKSNGQSVADLLSHLSDFISNEKISKPQIEYMNYFNDNWIYTLQSNKSSMYAYNRNRYSVFEGTIENQKYWQDPLYLNSLLKEFEQADTIITSMFDQVYVSESKGIISFWNEDLKKHHKPSGSFPEYTDNQREVLLGQLVFMFNKNNSFKISLSNEVSTKNAFGIYTEENKSWLYLEDKRNPQFRTINNVTGKIPKEIVDLFIDNTKTNEEFHFESVKGSFFFLSNDNTLSRINNIDNSFRWKTLGSLDGVSNNFLPELFLATLDYLSINSTVDTLFGFKYFDLSDNQIVLWGNQAAKQSIIRNKANGETKNILQSLFEKYSDSQTLLDQFFTDCRIMINPEKIEHFQGNNILGFYNPESKFLHLQRNNERVRKMKIEPNVFRLVNSSNDVRKQRIIDALLKKLTEEPKLRYSDKGFYFYYANEIIYFFEGLPQNNLTNPRFILVSKLRSNVNTNLGGCLGVNIETILNDICLNGKRPNCWSVVGGSPFNGSDPL